MYNILTQEIMGKDKYMEWYFNNIHPKIMSIAKREVYKTDIKSMPMTKFLFTFIKITSKCD